MSPITAEHPLVKTKVLAGLSLADAIDVTERQLAHDDALEVAEKEKAEAAEAAAKVAAKAKAKAEKEKAAE